MKKTFLIIGIAAFSFASAQDNGNPVWKTTTPKAQKAPFILFNGADTDSFWDFHALNQAPSFQPQEQLLYTLSNGNKLNLLPQDHMPCIIPDMTQFNMPVVKPHLSRYSSIPNTANPPLPKIEKVSPEKLKELQDYLDRKSKNTN
jgi:hypothetical protein